MPEQKTLSLPRRIHGAVVWILFGLVAVAGGLGIAAAIQADLPDWYMHLGMWGVLVIYILLYLNSFYGRRRLRQWFNLLVFVGVSFFWMHVLTALVPAQTMAAQGEIVERAALPMLWVPMALLVAANLLLIAHAVAIGRWRWESDPAPSRDQARRAQEATVAPAEPIGAPSGKPLPQTAPDQARRVQEATVAPAEPIGAPSGKPLPQTDPSRDQARSAQDATVDPEDSNDD